VGVPGPEIAIGDRTRNAVACLRYCGRVWCSVLMAPTDAVEELLIVDGEQFRVRLRPRHGHLYEYDYEWLTGPNEGYGFGVSGPFEESKDEHTARIRDFLVNIDPASGYLR
jgi:hypothetical protein